MIKKTLKVSKTQQLNSADATQLRKVKTKQVKSQKTTNNNSSWNYTSKLKNKGI